ncbi:MAG: hypothetical protein O7C75_11470 [Verrucomicrobia bacterium]|nr:hypothetical protein [Verrucomicrobiota bacterium]
MQKISNIRGIYRDILKGKEGDTRYDSGWVSNAIVDKCRVLLAGFMKNESSNGIQYLAVGKGLEQWDTTGAPAPDPVNITALENKFMPTIPVSELQLAYLDENEAEVAGPTHRLQITATLNPAYPEPIPPGNTYPLREFGLFGQLDSTDFMIDVIRHPVIHKDASSTLIRVVRLFF